MDIPTQRCPGVYAIVNTTSKKVYVGSAARSLQQRAKAHRDLLNRGKHPNIHLQRSWHKHGSNVFKLVVLEECQSSECIAKEQQWIDVLSSAKNGYNICPKAGSREGVVHSKETKEKIALAKQGKKLSEETKQKMSNAQQGRVFTEAAKDKLKKCHWSKGPKAKEIADRIAERNKGKTFSKERRMNISLGRRKKH